MESITYSLKGTHNNSNEYYEEIKSFTDEILYEFEHFETSAISDFVFYLEKNDISKIRSYNEYIFEFLMLGILWRIYSQKASCLDENPQKILEDLVKERNQNEPAKETIDIIRGMLMKPFLLSEDSKTLDLTINNFEKLLVYLKAVGDFNQELKRLEVWKDFLKTKTPEISSKYLTNAFLFADWFEYRSKDILGQYTANVNKFLAEKYRDHFWKEDVIFCGRKEVEYHLNMVGAEIMNRSFKNEFNERPRKALLLPGCMRISQELCKAEETNLGLKCRRCTKHCNVNQLTDIGNKYEFEVYIVSHESSAFSKSSKKDRDELGIVGVACVSNLIAGGWKSDSLGIPAQCVLLDSASCKNHWHDEGVPTDINVDRLLELMNIKLVESNTLTPIPVYE